MEFTLSFCLKKNAVTYCFLKKHRFQLNKPMSSVANVGLEMNYTAIFTQLRTVKYVVYKTRHCMTKPIIRVMSDLDRYIKQERIQ